MNKPLMSFDTAAEARVMRYGMGIAAGLSEQSNRLPADISERLRFAREQALAKAREARAAAPVTQTAQAVVDMGGSLALKGGPRAPRWLKLASLPPLLLLLAGLALIQHSQWYQQIQAAADVDTALLAKPLPPAAYSDPGFREYLNEDEEQHE